MKKVVMSIALAGLVSSVSAADIASKDAAFLFGNSNVNAVAMNSAEMVATEGQLLEILNPVLGVVTGLPLVGPLVGSLAGSLVGSVGSLLGTVEGLVGGVVGLVPVAAGAALPVKASVGLDLGALLNINNTTTVNSPALPVVITGVAGLL